MPRQTIQSEIPGRVMTIEAPVGSDVTEDDPVLMLESMKMEIPVVAPVAGKIIEILVAEEDTVEEGQDVGGVRAAGRVALGNLKELAQAAQARAPVDEHDSIRGIGQRVHPRRKAR